MTCVCGCGCGCVMRCGRVLSENELRTLAAVVAGEPPTQDLIDQLRRCLGECNRRPLPLTRVQCRTTMLTHAVLRLVRWLLPHHSSGGAAHRTRAHS